MPLAFASCLATLVLVSFLAQLVVLGALGVLVRADLPRLVLVGEPLVLGQLIQDVKALIFAFLLFLKHDLELNLKMLS